MGRTALLVIDMLNDYLHADGRVFCERCRDIIPAIAASIDFARDNGVVVAYVNTALESDGDVLATRWGLHAVTGTWGAQVTPELAPTTGDWQIAKKGYNGFFRTDLDRRLRTADVSQVVVSGIHTHVCVLLTAVSAFEHGYAVTILEDCITTGYRPNHESRLRFFQTHVGELLSSRAWMRRHSATPG